MQVAAARALVRSDPTAAEARLAEVERMVGEAQHELTGLIRELRPAALGDKGLVPALREWVADWSHGSGIAAEVRVQGERPAPLEVEQALFRVAQEALSNVARHSGARTVDVRVAWEDEALTLAIQDDGHGFDLAERDGKGVGLGSMRERVEALGGTLLVFGQADGTRVEARVPLAAQGTMAALADGTQSESAQTEGAGASPQTVKDEAKV
jgi:NarL family two-component system sensor histidine kinase LiaS